MWLATLLMILVLHLGSIHTLKTTYISTRNISLSNWHARLRRTVFAKNILDCGYKCNYWKSLDPDNCNSYSFDVNMNKCEMAFLDFLEDPETEPTRIYIEIDEVPNLPMFCRGGQSCCNKNHLLRCGENEGDCDFDEDCEGSLVCGNNNCLDTRSPFAFYDEEDDCCERACKPNNPCKEGDGHCETDSDCAGSWLHCGDNNCKDANVFPQSRFFWNYIVDIYSDTDNCCYKMCRPEALCDVNEYGCENDDDCLDGLYCDKYDHYCRDINECDINNGRVSGYIKCGRYVDCVNIDRSFTCVCKTGFENFVEYEGCTDIDECADNTHSCNLGGELCFNTIGSYVCVCNEGFTGEVGSCVDVDECSLGTHTCSPKTVLHAETSDLNDEQIYDYDHISINGSSYRLLFDVAGSGTCQISIGSGDIFYKFEISEAGIAAIYKVIESQDTVLKDHNLNPESKLQDTNYVHYFVQFDTNGEIQFGEKDSVIFSTSDSTFLSAPVQVDVIALRTLSKVTYWRNIQLGVSYSTECINTVGSFICQPKSHSNLAIGFGGHTRYSSSEFFHELQVITDKLTVCGSHNFPLLSKSLIRSGIAELDGWLYVCGGKKFEDLYPNNVCTKFDLNNPGGSWVSSSSLPNSFYIHSMMITINQSIYVIGGEYISSTSHYSLRSNYEFNHATNTWTSKAEYPFPVQKSGIIADEDEGKIWVLGGDEYGLEWKSHVYYYLVEENTWNFHSYLYYDSVDNTCQIIYSYFGNKTIICTLGHIQSSLWKYDLTADVGWTHIGNLRYSYTQHYMSMIKLDRYNAILVGGWTQQNEVSTRNFFVYDPIYNQFHDKYYYLQNAAKDGFWTSVKKSRKFRVLQNCESESRTYAAVGWGGHTADVSIYPTNWHVILRKRTVGYSGKPISCHNIIPDLAPGRKHTMITSVGYKLLVCGGVTVDLEHTDKCYKFETNKPNQQWKEIESMITQRNGGFMLSYADAAYIIGGYLPAEGTYTASVHRWTEKEKWKVMADFPKNIEWPCGVADDRYGNLFVGGGRSLATMNEQVYKYNIEANSWTSIGEPRNFVGVHCGATIIEKRSDGHLALVFVGGAKDQIYYIDLTNYHNSGSIVWNYHFTAHSSTHTRLVSLSYHEHLELGGYTSRWGVNSDNAFFYDYDTEAFQSIGLSLAQAHRYGVFTRVPDEAWIFKNCSAT